MKTLRNLIAVLTAAIVFSTAFAQAVFADDIKIIIDGSEVVSDVAPIMVNERTMVPLRAISEGLRAEVIWDDASETVTVVKDSTIIAVQIDNVLMTVDDYVVTMDVAPIMVNERTMVPLRAISEAFGCDVRWVDETQTVIITSADDEHGFDA